MTAALVAAVLEEWRRAERLADGLPAGSADRRLLLPLVSELRLLYAELTDTATAESVELAVRAHATLEDAISVLNTIATRVAAGATGPAPAG